MFVTDNYWLARLPDTITQQPKNNDAKYIPASEAGCMTDVARNTGDYQNEYGTYSGL